MLYNVYDNLVNCPTQPTCIAHFVLCISQIHNEKYERNTAGQLANDNLTCIMLYNDYDMTI